MIIKMQNQTMPKEIKLSQKSNKRLMAETITKRKKGKAKKRAKDAQPIGTKKGRELSISPTSLLMSPICKS